MVMVSPPGLVGLVHARVTPTRYGSVPEGAIGVNSIAISNLPPNEKVIYKVQCSELTMVIESSAREVWISYPVG
jgi:hypothetical protein